MRRAGWRTWLWAAGLCVVVAGALAWWALRPHSAAVPSARQYLNVTACLLAGPRGVVPGSSDAPVWQEMEQASSATRVMVSYLPAMGPGADVPMLVNTLVQRRCGVIVVAADIPSAPVSQAARANPHQEFLIVTPAAVAGPRVDVSANAPVVPAADAAARIGQALRALADAG